MFGTLLGLHRDGDIVDNDDDLDFGVDISQFQTIKTRLLQAGYVINDGEDPNTTDYFIQAHRIVDGHKILLDFYFWEHDEETGNLVVKWTISADQSRDDDLHIPYADVYPVTRKIHQGIEMLYPANAEACCVAFYGPNWRIPLQKQLDYDYRMENHAAVITYHDDATRIKIRDELIRNLQGQINRESVKHQYIEEILKNISGGHGHSADIALTAADLDSPATPSTVAAVQAAAHVLQARLTTMIDLLMGTLTTARIFDSKGPLGALLSEEMLMALTQTVLDKEWYLRSNPDVAAAGVDPFWHFLQYGYREGRSPHPLFKR